METDTEYLTKCVVDPSCRSFYLYSNEGDKRVIDCDTPEQFTEVLEFVRAIFESQSIAADIVYAPPLTDEALDFSTKMTF